MLKFFRLPFATTGDKTAVPDAVDSNGNVSYSQGYGFDYQRQKTDPAAKNIERDKMNQILFDITTAIAEIQAQGAPDYITSALNGGSAYSYGQYAIVKYSGALYISLVAANTAPPTDATKWALLPTPALLQQAAYMSAVAGGTVDALTAAFAPAIASLPAAPGTLSVFVRAAGANATTTPTFKADGTAAKTIVKGNNLPLVANDIAGAGHWLELQYDATLDKWVLQNPATGVTQLPTVNIGQLKNLFINGGCEIAQRAVMAAINLSTTPTYGAVDQVACWGTGTAVSAGTITQDAAATIGRTGYALKLAGVTITGAGVVFARRRVWAKHARRLKAQTASFAVRVLHDVGAAVNYVVTIRKPNAANNYSGTTVIATGSAQSVPNATDTLVKFEGIAMGDCSNGIEVEVQAQCGAVTAKNFSFTEWQLEEAAACSTFEQRDPGIDMSLCRDFLRVLSASDSALGEGAAYSTVAFFSTISFDKPMTATPALQGSASGNIRTFDGAGTTVAFSSMSLDGTSTSPSSACFALNGSGYTVNRGGVANITSGAVALTTEL